MRKIKYVVYSSDLEGIPFIKESKKVGRKCIPVIDTRSAVYVATGICAQNNESVVVCVNSSNASRSVFSGMTEAFYRNLQVALVTFGQDLDYSKELSDIVNNHYIVSNGDEIEQLLSEEYPMHIEVLCDGQHIDKIECSKTQSLLCSLLDSDKYLYIGQGIEIANNQYRCKTVQGGMPNCYEGALSNILGASLARVKNRYIGLVSEDEFIHDINTLGNININELLFFIVVGLKENKIIMDYARSLLFSVDSIKEEDMVAKKLEKLVNNKKKTLLMIYKED